MQKSTLLFCFLLVFIFVTQLGAQCPPFPEIKLAQGQGVVGLDFSSSGNNQQIAIFVISVNDTPGTFKVRFEFANSYQFKCATSTNTIPMTDLVWKYISGSLGTGLTEPADKDMLHHLNPDGISYDWQPQGTGQKTVTNYILELRASWNNPVRILTGFYSEIITATVITE
jgi:hypothetical protein